MTAGFDRAATTPEEGRAAVHELAAWAGVQGIRAAQTALDALAALEEDRDGWRALCEAQREDGALEADEC